jgi:hypothetical protein
MNTFAQNVWTISPPNLDALLEALQTRAGDNTTKLILTLEATFTREKVPLTTTYKVGEGTLEVDKFRPLIEIVRNGTESDVDDAVEIKDIIPLAMRLTRNKNGVGDVKEYGTLNKKGITLKVKNSVMKSSDGRPGYIRTYWIHSQMPESDTKGIPESDTKGVIFQVMPDMATQTQGLLASLKVTDITTFYVVIIFTALNMLRNFCLKPMYELPYEEMPESEHLLDLCECIQELRRDGKTKDEMLLFRRLLRIMRSQELLLLITKTKYE